MKAAPELKDSPLLRLLRPEVGSPLFSAASLMRFPEGSCVYRAGDPIDTLYVLVKGAITLEAEDRGDVTTVADLRPGDILGERLSLQPGVVGAAEVAKFTARVTAESQLAAIPGNALREALPRVPNLVEFFEELRDERTAASGDMASLLTRF